MKKIKEKIKVQIEKVKKEVEELEALVASIPDPPGTPPPGGDD